MPALAIIADRVAVRPHRPDSVPRRSRCWAARRAGRRTRSTCPPGHPPWAGRGGHRSGLRGGGWLPLLHRDRRVGRRPPGRHRGGAGHRPRPATVRGDDPPAVAGPRPRSAHHGDRRLARRADPRHRTGEPGGRSPWTARPCAAHAPPTPPPGMSWPPATSTPASCWPAPMWTARPTRSPGSQPLLDQIGDLRDTVVTADALHCQRDHVDLPRRTRRALDPDRQRQPAPPARSTRRPALAGSCPDADATPPADTAAARSAP